MKEVRKPSEKDRQKAPDRVAPENPFQQLVRGEHGDPFAILGQHPIDGGTGRLIRVFAPEAAQGKACVGQVLDPILELIEPLVLLAVGGGARLVSGCGLRLQSSFT